MKSYIVYMHISPSNKRYIGITSQSVNKRWRNGKGYLNNKHFYNAINKYGWENFQHIIITRGLSEDEAKWLEIELIKIWNSNDEKYGYNNTLGGDGVEGYSHSEEAKRKISINNSGENNPMYGKDWREGKTIEELKKIKQKQLENTPKGENHYMYGKSSWDYMNEDAKNERLEKLTERMTGGNNFNAKSVICLTTRKIFGSAKEGERFYNSAKHVNDCCRGKRKSCGKLNGEPLIWMYLSDFLCKCVYTLL